MVLQRVRYDRATSLSSKGTEFLKDKIGIQMCTEPMRNYRRYSDWNKGRIKVRKFRR